MKKELLASENPGGVAEIELVYRPKIKAANRPIVKTSKDSYDFFKKCWNENILQLQEVVKVLLLNTRGSVLGVYTVSIGCMDSATVDPRLVFGCALKAAASSLILAHNHPSGNVKPSRRDIELTQTIKDAGNLLSIKLLDHIIVSAEGYFSFADSGLI